MMDNEKRPRPVPPPLITIYYGWRSKKCVINPNYGCSTKNGEPCEDIIKCLEWIKQNGKS